MARILDISVQHLGRLSKSGDLPGPVARGRWDVVVTVHGYLEYREREQPAANVEAKSEELLLIAERRRLTKEQADKFAYANAQIAGELVSVAQIEARLTTAVIGLRRTLQLVARKVRRKFGTTPEVERAIGDHIDGAITRFVEESRRAA